MANIKDRNIAKNIKWQTVKYKRQKQQKILKGRLSNIKERNIAKNIKWQTVK